MIDMDYIRYLVRNHNDELGLANIALYRKLANDYSVKPIDVARAVKAVRTELSLA